MIAKFLRLGALLLAMASVLVLLYGRGLWAGHDQHRHGSAAPGAAPAEPALHSHAAASGGIPGERRVLYWYDPMHPAYKSDKPGIAPDCGVQLVPKYAADDSTSEPMPPGTVMISPQKQQLMGVRTATVARESLVRTIRTTGQVAVDEARIAHVHVKVSGWIDKVYVDFVGQLVRKGQPLFTLYSPDLVATQEEYLIARRGENSLGSSPFAEVRQGANSLLRATRDRLKLWDISEAQIEKLERTGEVSRTMTFYSPVTGFVTDRKAFPQTSVTPDMELYTVANLSTVWVMADIYQYELPYVRVGQRAEVQLSYYPGKTYTGRVSYIYPILDAQTRTAKVRVDLPNPGFKLKPEMFADVQLQVNYGKQLVVPQEAVLDSGERQTVFVAAGDGHFVPRAVKIGPQVEGKDVILSGLQPGEVIVSSGNFLIDSESQLKDAMSGMQH
ncbi:MAG TPA: efflux RND transporter periplasmic adaptor subunit [Terriglobales bacterium]|jgi:Cu(I)/Ag(I) efflux system membrane fusion protein|nr:efflux RND transporter periplasmic adaptor subunit [Terriglobales bacterium]